MTTKENYVATFGKLGILKIKLILFKGLNDKSTAIKLFTIGVTARYFGLLCSHIVVLTFCKDT